MFKKILCEKKITQTELASALGVTQQLVSAWVVKKSKPNYMHLRRISKILNISIDELLKSFEEVEDLKKEVV